MSNPQRDAQYESFTAGTFAYFAPESNGQIKPLVVSSIFDAQGYTVDREFDDPKTGFQALGLRSKDGSKPPVLVFQAGNGNDAETATDPAGFGLSQFKANKQAIQDWLTTITNDKQLNPQGFKPDVTGQSLGGILTQRAASELPTLIGSAVSFEAGGIDLQTADKFLTNGGNPNQVTHYIVDGDVRSLLGEEFIPGKVVVSTSEVKDVTQGKYFVEKHTTKILADIASLIPPGTVLPPSLQNLLTKPTNQKLSEISVDELNRGDFTFKGKDWQDALAKIRTNNPNLEKLISNRQSFEELRYTNDLENSLQLADKAVKGENPVPPNRVNQPTTGDDVLFGTVGGASQPENRPDKIDGLAGNDYIRGGASDDRLFGNEGKDALIGNAGNDILVGGAGDDILTGGKGNDRFIFGDNPPFNTAALGIDRINDFTPGEDLIGLSKATFGNLGQDLASAFGTVADDAGATTSTASIVYNTSNGKLFYNNNGSQAGFGDGGQFASVFDKPALSAENFTLT